MGTMGEVRKTELGSLPSDWGIVSVRDITSGHKQGFYSNDQYVNDGIKLVRITDLRNPKIDYESMPELKINKNDFESYKIKIGDFLFARSGAIGRFGIVYEEIDAVFASYLIRFNFNLKVISNEYFGFMFESGIVKKQLSSITQGSSNININANNIKDIKIPLPSVQEQREISSALLEFSRLITNLESLIDKKNALKQATMQQLLNGKIRIPGHSGKWETKNLKDICGNFTTGKLDANAMKTDGEFPFFTCAKGVYRIDKFAFDVEALLISGNGANVGYVHYYNGKFNAYQRTYVLTNFNSNIKYIKQYLDKYLADRIKVEVNAGNTPYITMDTLTEMEIRIPVALDEQNAIAEILELVDEEINFLEKKLEKLKFIKLGLMQELLSGRIRLL